MSSRYATLAVQGPSALDAGVRPLTGATCTVSGSFTHGRSRTSAAPSRGPATPAKTVRNFVRHSQPTGSSRRFLRRAVRWASCPLAWGLATLRLEAGMRLYGAASTRQRHRLKPSGMDRRVGLGRFNGEAALAKKTGVSRKLVGSAIWTPALLARVTRCTPATRIGIIPAERTHHLWEGDHGVMPVDHAGRAAGSDRYRWPPRRAHRLDAVHKRGVAERMGAITASMIQLRIRCAPCVVPVSEKQAALI